MEDLLRAGDDRALELIGGDIVEKAQPSFDHGTAQAGLSHVLGGFRGGGGGPHGPGGWWLGVEVDVLYGAHDVYRHDLSGWRRERVPERPRGRPVSVRPDWVCEVVSRSNASNDRVRKLRGLHRYGVPHYWLLDPEEGTLSVLRWAEPGYLTVLVATVDETVRAEPFESIEISLPRVLDLD